MTLEEYMAQQNALFAPPPVPGVDPFAPAPVEPPEIEMPAQDARLPEIEMTGTDFEAERAAAAPAIKIGQPHVPEFGAASMPDAEHAFQRAKIDAALANQPQPGALQPGLGIPVASLDQFAPAAGQQAAHEQAVDARIEGSERLPDDPMRARTPQEATEDRIAGSERLAELPDAHETQFDAETARLGGMSGEDAYRDARMRQEQERLDDEQRKRDLLKKADDEAMAAQKIRTESRRRYMQEQADIDTRRQALLQERAGAEDWYREGGIGRSVGAVLLGALGGFVQHLNGGKNLGLDSVNRSIDRFIASRQADIERQRGLLGDRSQSLMARMDMEDQDWREQQALRQAALERAKFEIETQQQSFDPESSRAQALDGIRRQIDGELAAQRVAAQEASEKKWEGRLRLSWDIEKNQRERDENRRKEQEAADKHAAAQKKLAGGGLGKPKDEDIVYTPEQWAARGVKGVAAPMSAKQLRSLQGLQKSSQDIAANNAGMSKEHRENSIPGIKNQDGSTFVATGRPEDISKARDQIGAAKLIIKRMDDALRTRTGWSSDVGNSDQRKKLQAQWGNVKVDAKNLLDLGAITAADVPLIEGVVGTDDPSSWKDPTAGILEARRLIEDRVNTKLQSLGYEGERWTITPPSTKKPERTADDLKLEKLQNSDVGSLTSYIVDTEEDVEPSKRVKRNVQEQNAAHRESGGIPPGLRQQLDIWTVQARSAGPEGEKARAYLVNLVETGGNDAVKNAARAGLEAANLVGLEPVGASTSVAREAVALPPPKPKKGGR